jgi:hypothetical protein
MCPSPGTDAVQLAQPGCGVLVVHGRSSHVRCPARLAGHVVGPALATADQVLAVGDQALVQLTGEQRDAVHTGLVLKPVAGHADLAAPGLHQHILVQKGPLLSWQIDSIDRPLRAGTTKRHQRLHGSTSVLATARAVDVSLPADGKAKQGRALERVMTKPAPSKARGGRGGQFLNWHEALLRTNENHCGAGVLNFGFGCRLRRFSGCPIATTLRANPPSGAILRLTTKCGKS